MGSGEHRCPRVYQPGDEVLVAGITTWNYEWFLRYLPADAVAGEGIVDPPSSLRAQAEHAGKTTSRARPGCANNLSLSQTK